MHPHQEGAESYVLLGGEGHTVGQGTDTRQRYAVLEAFARHFNISSPSSSGGPRRTTGPPDGLPYVGAIPSDADHILVATGFNKWGMTNGTAAGMILSDIILGHPNAGAPAFDATRLAPGASAKEVVTENLDAAKHLVSDRLAGLPADDVEIDGSAESAPAQAVHGDLGVDNPADRYVRDQLREEAPMAEGLDVTAGWCCDGRTWTEHAHEGGECCQPKGTKIEDLPPEAQQAAKERLAKAANR